MTKFKILAAAAILSTVVASPVMARDYNDQAPRGAYTHHHRADSGFWPADAAAGIVGGAIGTAGALAAAPFGNTYASYDRPYEGGPYQDSYAYYDGPAYSGPARYGYAPRHDSLSRIGSGASASFGNNGGGTRSPAADGDIGN
jgi:hypothetical protein